MPKLKEKDKATNLRKKGFSYSEILKEISVAKSTLSLWLRDVGLAKKQKQRLTEKKIAAALRGATKKRSQRLAITEEIKNKARDEVKRLSYRELWLIGTALYWAEGTKERSKATNVQFSNSDPAMIKLFLEWLRKICKISEKDIHFVIFLHENAARKIRKVRRYWAGATGFPMKDFQKITWKKNKIRTKRKNINEDYFGLLRIVVRRSTNLNRKIQGWTDGIYKNCGVV